MMIFSNTKKRLSRKTICLALVGGFLGSFIAPAPAHASCSTLCEVLKEVGDNIVDAVYESAAGTTEALSRMAQAIVDNAARGPVVANKTTTLPGDNLLCNIVTANQVENATRIYADVLTDFLTRNVYDFVGIGITKNPGKPLKVGQETTPGVFSSYTTTYTMPRCYGPGAGHSNRGGTTECTVNDMAEEMLKAQCALKTASPKDLAMFNSKTGMYEDQSGIYDKCTDVSLNGGNLDTAAKTPKGAVELVRADRRMDTIFETLEFVPLDTTDGWDKLKQKQKLYLAAVNYCYMVYGSPAEWDTDLAAKKELAQAGAETNTTAAESADKKQQRPKGGAIKMKDNNILGSLETNTQVLVKAMRWDAIVARRQGVLNRCLQIVAEHTRPVCASGHVGYNEQLEAVCTVQNAVCTNAKLRGIDVSMFGTDDTSAGTTCTLGLSWAEARRLSNEGCLTTEEYVNLASTTTESQAQLAEHARRCTQLVESYRTNLNREKTDFAKMIAGLR